MHDLAVTGGVVASDGAVRRANVFIDGDRVTALTTERRAARRTLRLDGAVVAPGLIELHLNGAAGLDFTAGRLDPLGAFEQWLLAHGVTSYLAALNTAPLAERLASLKAVRKTLFPPRPGRPECLGCYLEGPYYVTSQCGAHDPGLMKDPDRDEALAVLGAAPIRIWSLAPERRGATAFIAALAARGVVPAIGHSAAGMESVAAAVTAGARLVTHAYACLTAFSGSGATKRLGGNEAALAHERLTLEVIADGAHTTPELLRWLLAAAGWRRLCLTTDAMAAAGLGDGSYEFLGAKVEVIDGRAYRPDRTHFAGSTATLDDCLANLRSATGLTPAEAVATATRVPARLLGLYPRRGALAPGSLADLAVFDRDGSVVATICRGVVAFLGNPTE